MPCLVDLCPFKNQDTIWPKKEINCLGKKNGLNNVTEDRDLADAVQKLDCYRSSGFVTALFGYSSC